MSAKNIYLWVSCLAMAALSASCSGQAGSPIQSDLDAVQSGEQSAPYNNYDDYLAEQETLSLPGMPDEMAGGDAKGASYTPGMAAMIGGGMSFPSPLQYGWKSGIVNDLAAAGQVQMLSAPGTPLAWNAYAFKEMAVGRLQTVTLKGFGKNLAVYMYNWNAPSWTFMGIHNLAVATPVNLAVPADCAPNGLTFMVCVQLAPAETFITGLETNVF